MKTEELMQLGLNREQADRILAMNGRDIERTKNANQNERLELERLRGEIKQKEEMLSAYEALDIDGLKNELSSWREKAEQAEAEFQKRENQSLIQKEAERLYRENGVKNAELLDALMDWEKVTVSEGEVVGAKEQLFDLKEKYGYLFQAETPVPSFSQSVGGVQKADESGAIRQAMGI